MYYVYAISSLCRNYIYVGLTDSTARQEELFARRTCLSGDMSSADPFIDPLDRCGLLFAGANTAWSGRSADLPVGVQNGILTAREITLMDLRDADLVVLSACETGAGDITGEGVFGLQRAFKQAGAKTIVMSLWNVSDNVTQAMMYKFYTFWLSGMTKKAAFDHARNELQKIYVQPYYWAGFVMLD